MILLDSLFSEFSSMEFILQDVVFVIGAFLTKLMIGIRNLYKSNALPFTGSAF